MWFGYVTLVVAFFLSVVAAYYSVLGLTAIFSAAVIPVIIMGGALETGKVVAAMWLHRNWHRAPWTYKVYLLPSLLALMLLTSMGTFGFLSKAHSDQNLVSGDVQAKIAIYDEKIRVSRENIDANRQALKQLDAAVDQIMGRSTTEQGAERSVQIRRQQTPERQRLIREIEAEQKKISSLNEERAPIAAEVRKVEAEVGPIKYIAALVYEDTQDSTVLERAVRWVIILIVAVFDPLAIVLILAGSRHLEWERAARIQSSPKPAVVDAAPDNQIQEPTSENLKEPVEPSYLVPGTWFRWRPFEEKPLPAYLTKPWRGRVPGIHLGPQVYQETTTTSTTTTSTTSTTTTTTTQAPDINIDDSQDQEPMLPNYNIVGNEFINVDGKIIHISSLQLEYPEIYNEIHHELTRKPSTFGREFPKGIERGHLHVDIGQLPTKLYKFNGRKWIEVDKTISDGYTHNAAYIEYLIDQLNTGTLTPDDLTETEQEMVRNQLKNG